MKKVLKWKQPKVWFAMLALLTAATLALAYKHNIDYQRYVQETTKWYVDRGINPGILDFGPWHIWGNGFLVILLGTMSIVLWMVLPVIWLQRRRNLRCKKPLVLIFLLIPMLFLSPVNIAFAYADRNVDILFAGDEEIMNGYIPWPDPIWWWLGVFYDRPLTEIIEEESFPGLQSSFKDQLGIDIVFHGWAEWDSDDGTNNAYYMLEEAIKEVGEGYWVSDPSWPYGGYWKFNRGMIWNGIVIDMLVAWTWQDIAPDGFAPFEWGAAIVQYLDIPRASYISQHEISHLYGLLHCSHAWCIMNSDYAWFTNDWQSTCKDYMIDHKDYFTRYVSGGGCPILSVFDGLNYVNEGLLDIHNPDGIDVLRNRTLITTPQPENNAFLLRLTEHPQTHSYMDQVKLFATLEDGTTTQLPLISAVHSEHGNVLPQLHKSDDVRTDTSANQTIDLRFAALNSEEVVDFIFQIEGHNMILKM